MLRYNWVIVKNPLFWQYLGIIMSSQTDFILTCLYEVSWLTGFSQALLSFHEKALLAPDLILHFGKETESFPKP